MSPPVNVPELISNESMTVDPELVAVPVANTKVGVFAVAPVRAKIEPVMEVAPLNRTPWSK